MDGQDVIKIIVLFLFCTVRYVLTLLVLSCKVSIL